MVKKLFSVLLTICITVSMVSVSFVNVSAGAGEFIGEFLTEKLVEVTMRGLAEGTEALGEATGNEEAEKAFSLIANWVFSDGAEAAAKKTQELCEEILERLDEIEEEMNDCFSVVEQMFGEETANTAKTNLDNKWDEDVDNVIKSYDAERSLELYLQYMQSAIDYSNKGLTGQDLETAVQPDLDSLIMSFGSMYSGNIPIEDNNVNDIKKYLFEDTSINSKFVNMISSLANNLVKSNSTSIAEYAAQFAYETYPFSHQQYSYVYTVMVKQLTQLQNVEMLYNEFLYQQGQYIEEKYGTSSAQYSGYLNTQTEFYNLMNNGDISVNAKILNMLDYEMTVDVSKKIKMTLNDYMKPEDSIDTVLQVEDFENSVTYYPSVISSVTYNTKFTTEKMFFNKVMANGEVYYIIDPNQFSYQNAMTLNALDVKCNIADAGDFHYVSPDYLNLIRSMSDGTNTFSSTSNMEKYNNLFNTNSFRSIGSIPANYLSDYFPAKGEYDTYIITPKYKNPDKNHGVFTSYEDIYCINASDVASGSEPEVIDVNGELAESENGGLERKYSVILANEGDTYKQPLGLYASGDGLVDARIVCEDSNITINNGEEAVVTSGEMLSIKFKLAENAELQSLTWTRDNSSFSGIQNKTTYGELLDSDDLDCMTVDEDGYYSFEYAMPYSKSAFYLKANISPNTEDDSTYNISNAQDLIDFANTVNSGYTAVTGNVTADIDLAGYEDKFTPIGTSKVPFNGTFKGNNHTISGIKITDKPYALFCYISGATVKDLTVKGSINYTNGPQEWGGGVIGSAGDSTISNISSYVDINLNYSEVGGIVGVVNNSVVENCYNFGSVTGGSTDIGGRIGGVVGYSDGGILNNCGNHGSVISNCSDVGGVLGYDSSHTSTVEYCYNVSDVSGDYHVGGIVGSGSTESNFSLCYNSGNIKGNYYVGGIAGSGLANYCYNLGNISGNHYPAGVVGSGSAINCYSIGKIEGANAGGVGGYFYLGCKITNCYFLDICGAGDKNATQKTAQQFASGEVAYLLNNSVTDGSQIWYQNIDNSKTPDDYPKFDGGTVYGGYVCTKEEKLYSNSPLSDNPFAHNFDDNGFCKYCGAYQPANLKSSGVYEISNAGQLFWFAALVNGDNTHAEFNQQDKSANGYLIKDIDLEGREWTPIKDYSGDFSGNESCPTISGFSITKDGGNLGLFESVSGAISDFKLEGSITSTSTQDYWFVGGIAGESDGAEITNVISDVDINCQVAGSVGGLVGLIQNSGKIQNCMYSGTMNVSVSMFGIGGIVGCTDLYGPSDNIISNCANLGNISANNSSISTGGIVGFMMYKAYVCNCYNYGNISVCNRNDVEHCGALIGLVAFNSKIENNYYREGSAANAFGKEVEFESKVIPKTADEFASGEVAYLLNSEVTDGTQTWYQNIDNGKTPDDYPKFDGGTVYKIADCSGASTYSNDKSGGKADHQFDENGFCKVCGSYQPAVLNSNGVYEISNAGQFFWFASLVNGDKTHAEFDSQNSAANAVLVKDIDLESREWLPIGSKVNYYSGIFDGRNYSIHNINGMLFGSVSGSTLKNICVDSGSFKGNSDYAVHTGSIVGTMYNGTITHSYSKAVSGDVVGDLGGIAGKAYGTITDCYFAGTLNGTGTTGGLAGSSWNVNEPLNIKNCYVSANSINGNSNTGGFVGWLHGNSSVVNSFYNSTAYNGNLFGTSQNENCTNEEVKALSAKSYDEFKSGEVTYLLNSEVTDGTQVWHQNIDNGETPDDYPNFDGGTVYYLSYKEAYSNIYSEPPAEPDAFEKDDDGNLIIKTYDDLVKLSQLIRSDYEVYGSQTYILTKNIKATDDSEWTQGIGSVADNKAFNGTFDGNGYCIIGLNVNSSEYGGLFEIIGEKGCVKDLFVFDCDFKSSSDVSGGIASINNGTIDHCISGVNLTTGTIHINSEISIDAVALNSAVKGEISGGIAGENTGLITGCRNASVVTGTQCGGIAGENVGKIYGCANSVKIGTSTSSVSGGLAGKNSGTIESSYNSGAVNGNSEKSLGSIAGINGYQGSENPTVKNVFYSTVNNLNSVGTDSLSTPDDTNRAKTKNSDFQSDVFVNELNSVSDDTVVWVRNSSFNKGNPIIKGNFFKYSVKSAGNNITVEGSMHKALNIQYNACIDKDEEYSTITSALGKANVLGIYSVSLTDNSGNYIPAELWCQGEFKITVPVNSKNVEFAGLDTDGNVTCYKPESVENGVAVFTVSHPMSFAVVDSTNNNISDNKSPDDVINTSNDNTPIQTGSTVCCAALLLVLFASVVMIVIKRRNRFE